MQDDPKDRREECASTSKLAELDSPRRWAIHGIDGPIRADAQVEVVPLNDPPRSRVTIRLDFHGQGVGKFLAPMGVRQARKEVPQSCQKLKQILEA